MTDEQPDLSMFLLKAQALQERIEAAQEEVVNQVVCGSAGSGAVKVEVTGNMEFRSVRIDPSSAGDVELLEDLVLAALHDAMAQVSKLTQSVMDNATDGMFG